MPRNNVTADEIRVRIYKLKTALYEGQYKNKSGDWHDGAHHMLTTMLNVLDEYRH